MPNGNFVTRFYVAGVQHRLDQGMIRSILPGPVSLDLEPDNPYDPLAIKVIAIDPEGFPIHLGYVPAKNGTNAAIHELVADRKVDAELVLVDPDAKPYQALAVEVRGATPKEDPAA